MSEHKNAKWVKMYVEGKPVQWKMAGIDGAYHTWESVTSLQQFDDQGLMFREKPRKVITKGYKRYAHPCVDDTDYFVFVVHEGDDLEFNGDEIEIDKEWQYYEVEVSE